VIKYTILLFVVSETVSVMLILFILLNESPNNTFGKHKMSLGIASISAFVAC